MSDSTDMSTPVTRGEFAQFEIRLEQRLAQLATKAEIAQLATKAEIAQLATKAEIAQLATKVEIAQLATKAELEIWGGALLARLLERIDSSERRLLAELARHTRASYEDM
jgi:glutamate racemase